MDIEDIFPKPVWKAVEFVGHMAMTAAPAFGLSYVLPFWACAIIAMLAGLGREVRQNWNDGIDESTLFMVSRLPVNPDMLIDIGAYALGLAAISPLFF